MSATYIADVRFGAQEKRVLLLLDGYSSNKLMNDSKRNVAAYTYFLSLADKKFSRNNGNCFQAYNACKKLVSYTIIRISVCRKCIEDVIPLIKANDDKLLINLSEIMEISVSWKIYIK